jgi:hypothetical protein
MKNKTNKSIRVMLPVVFLLLISCATIPKQPPPPPGQLRADLGRIGIVSGNFQPEVTFQKPMSKGNAALHFAGVGAEVGANVAGSIAISPGQGVGAAAVALGALGLIPVGALAGSIVGVIEGEPSKKIREAEDTLNSYVARINFQETIRERFLSGAREQTQYPLVLIEGQGPKALDEEITYGSLPDEDIDTLLEISFRKCNLQGIKGRINPPLRLLVAVGIRLIRVKDSKVLHSRNFVYEYESDLLKFSEWAANNAQPFKEELDRAFSYLALQILRELINIQAPLNSGSSGVTKN